MSNVDPINTEFDIQRTAKDLIENVIDCGGMCQTEASYFLANRLYTNKASLFTVRKYLKTPHKMTLSMLTEILAIYGHRLTIEIAE